MAEYRNQEQLAALINPGWFPDNGPSHVLNNYPGQAEGQRAYARQRARAIIEGVEDIIEDLSDRSGLGDEWNAVDGETRADIFDTWCELLARRQAPK